MTGLPEQKLPKHNFLSGHMVHLSRRYPPRKAAPGPYKVVCQLPERDGQPPLQRMSWSLGRKQSPQKARHFPGSNLL
jgi:hypothetical protein